MSREQLRILSKQVEGAHGCDSIQTIETHYLRGDQPGGAFMCCYSGASTMGQHNCTFRRLDPVAMWMHIHFTGHGRSFVGCDTPEQVAEALDAGTLTPAPVEAIRP